MPARVVVPAVAGHDQGEIRPGFCDRRNGRLGTTTTENLFAELRRRVIASEVHQRLGFTDADVGLERCEASFAQWHNAPTARLDRLATPSKEDELGRKVQRDATHCF